MSFMWWSRAKAEIHVCTGKWRLVATHKLVRCVWGQSQPSRAIMAASRGTFRNFDAPGPDFSNAEWGCPASLQAEPQQRWSTADCRPPSIGRSQAILWRSRSQQQPSATDACYRVPSCWRGSCHRPTAALECEAHHCSTRQALFASFIANQGRPSSLTTWLQRLRCARFDIHLISFVILHMRVCVCCPL